MRRFRRRGGKKRWEIGKACRLNRSKSFLPESTCQELPWPVDNQSPDLPLPLLCREPACLTHPAESYTTSYRTLASSAPIFPVISQGHINITTCILSAECLGPQAKKGDIPFPFALLFNYANEYVSGLHLQNESI